MKLELPEAHMNIGILFENMHDYEKALYHHNMSITYATSNEV